MVGLENNKDGYSIKKQAKLFNQEEALQEKYNFNNFKGLESFHQRWLDLYSH